VRPGADGKLRANGNGKLQRRKEVFMRGREDREAARVGLEGVLDVALDLPDCRVEPVALLSERLTEVVRFVLDEKPNAVLLCFIDAGGVDVERYEGTLTVRTRGELLDVAMEQSVSSFWGCDTCVEMTSVAPSGRTVFNLCW